MDALHLVSGVNDRRLKSPLFFTFSFMLTTVPLYLIQMESLEDIGFYPCAWKHLHDIDNSQELGLFPLHLPCPVGREGGRRQGLPDLWHLQKPGERPAVLFHSE